MIQPTSIKFFNSNLSHKEINHTPKFVQMFPTFFGGIATSKSALWKFPYHQVGFWNKIISWSNPDQLGSARPSGSSQSYNHLQQKRPVKLQCQPLVHWSLRLEFGSSFWSLERAQLANHPLAAEPGRVCPAAIGGPRAIQDGCISRNLRTARSSGVLSMCRPGLAAVSSRRPRS